MKKPSADPLSAAEPSRARLSAAQRHLPELRGHQIKLEAKNEELRITRTALEVSQAKYTALYDFAPLAYLTLDGGGHITQANLAAASLLGTKRARLMGKPFAPFVAGGVRPSFNDYLRQVLAREVPQSWEVVLVACATAGHHVLLTATRSADDDEYLLALVDITARKQMESQIRLLEAGVAQLNDAVIITEAGLLTAPGPRILFVNDAAEHLTGYTRAELIGRTPRMFQGPKTDRVELNRIATALRERKSVRAELINYSKAGTEYWSEVNISPVESDTGEVTHFVAIQRDITARKAAEAEICRLNAGLERCVSERTAELQATNQELEAFSYSVSHDLRAPLRHLTGFAELLQKNDYAKLDDRARRHLDFISESAVRMAQLIDDLLAFSRSGRAEVRKAPVNLEAMVKEVIQSLRPDTRGRQVFWQIAPLPGVHADANLLRAVLTNLLANALKFTQPRAEVAIQMGCTETVHEHIFFIRDNGVGFDMQYVEKLFGVFQRLHATDEFAGTGIGLANVRRIVSRHGGRTWAESVLNEGATFYFSLPKPTKTKHPKRKPI